VDANLAATRDLYANAEIAGVTIVSHNEHAEEFLKKTEKNRTSYSWIRRERDWAQKVLKSLRTRCQRNCVPFLRSIHPGSRFGGADGLIRKPKEITGQASAMKSRKCICSISSRRHFTSKP